MKRKLVNLEASVSARLLNIARATNANFELLLRRYAIERLLYRLGVSPHREQFVLKGAMLFTAWAGDPFRTTQDVDLLGFGDNAAPAISKTFQAICRQRVEDDALSFDAVDLEAKTIRGNQEYGGVRVRLTARLGKVRIPVQIDIGFGDAITPGAVDLEFPPLLDAPAPRLKAYPKETVVAEKLQAIVALGQANSRMKDYYDLIAISRKFAFDGEMLSAAISATFKRRGTEIPTERPAGLTDAFSHDERKMTQWAAFKGREALHLAVGELAEVVHEIAGFVVPAAAVARTETAFPRDWQPGGPWRAKA